MENSHFTLINLVVPQGSILARLLFLIYVNDLPLCLNSGQIIMFSDDTNLFFNSDSLIEIELIRDIARCPCQYRTTT